MPTCLHHQLHIPAGNGGRHAGTTLTTATPASSSSTTASATNGIVEILHIFFDINCINSRVIYLYFFRPRLEVGGLFERGFLMQGMYIFQPLFSRRSLLRGGGATNLGGGAYNTVFIRWIFVKILENP